MQRPFHRQFDIGGGIGNLHEFAGRRLAAQGDGFAFDAAQDVHDAAVFQPGLVVKKTAELLRELGDRALRVLAGFQPVVMDAPGAAIALQFTHGG